tara:strand:+ start:1102 stop:1458 length:357 start_codon:yes stop_codon:yes gene_type:complete
MWEYRVKVLRVIDGDTIDVSVDLGFFTHRNIRVRMYGINTPECRTRDHHEKKRGMAAKVILMKLLDEADEVIMKSHGIGKFGRCLGEIFVMKDGEKRDVGKHLIAAGLAEEYYGGKRK